MLRDGQRGIRLQKALADAGLGSRRRCEELVLEGEVRVNGLQVHELPAWVDPALDEIVVGGKTLPRPERRVYVMLNKPVRTVSTVEDPEGRRTVSEMVTHPSGVRLYPVGRLDYETSGLILLTNDGPLANQLTHPSFGVHKTYRATVKGRVEDEALRKLTRGVVITDRREGETTGASRTAPVLIHVAFRDNDKTILDITLREGRNRQIRRMFALIGHPVRKLMRTAMGPLTLKGVANGQWRELSAPELAALRRAAEKGERINRKKPGPPRRG
jgi:23S rRNA pseudouridine2605 synthase